MLPSSLQPLATTLVALVLAIGPSTTAGAQVLLFAEDFEGVALGPNVHETLVNPAAWTETPPAGWTVDDAGVSSFGNPNSGVAEWEGWSFADKTWWIAAAQDQQRMQFSRGQGVVAVADPDEWDDRGAPSANLGFFNAWMQTPAISLTDATGSTLRLQFDSSWRGECCDDGPGRDNDQTAVVRARFDTGEIRELVRWESTPASDRFKPDAVNEQVLVGFDRPADAQSVTLEFGLLDAGNDWWWALDNVRVEAVPDERLRLVVDRDSGRIALRNLTGTPQPLAGYQIVSAAGTLNPAGWTPVSGRLDGRGDGSLDGSPWIVASRPGMVDNLSELALGTALVPANAEVGLGPAAWAPYFASDADLSFSYADGHSGELLVGIVQFVGAGDVDFPWGDLDFDGDLDGEDWLRMGALFGAPLTNRSPAQRYRLADLNGDGMHTLDDVVAFQRAYDARHGTGAFARLAQNSVPETTSATLALACATWWTARRRRNRAARGNFRLTERARRPAPRGLLIVGCLLASGFATSASARTLFFENFDALPWGAPVDETFPGTNVWTNVPPAGWSIDNSGVPAGGVAEWRGWSFADSQWWAGAAADQGRSQFSRAAGGVAVADPDEWDDLPRDAGTYNTLLLTRPIALSGLSAGAARLRVDSSWRPEGDQRATIAASYDGGPFQEVAVFSSQLGDADYRPEAVDETVVVDLQNPAGAASLRLRFGLLDAGNNWWWALDNVEVFAPLTLNVDVATGVVALSGGGDRIRGYEIVSAAGGLEPAEWRANNLASQGVGAPRPATADFNADLHVDGADFVLWETAFAESAGGDATGDATTDGADLLRWQRQRGLESDPASTWRTLLAAPSRVIEALLDGDTLIDGQLPLGAAYDRVLDPRDLVLRYTLSDGTLLEGAVAYVTGGGRLASVPEPTSIICLTGAIGCFGTRQRRQGAGRK